MNADILRVRTFHCSNAQQKTITFITPPASMRWPTFVHVHLPSPLAQDQTNLKYTWGRWSRKKAGSDGEGKQSCCCSSLCRGEEGRMTVVTPWSVLQASWSLELKMPRPQLMSPEWNLAPLFTCSSDFVEALVVCREAFPRKSKRHIQTKTWDFWEALLAV